MLTRALLGLASRGGARGRLSILIFHRVLPEPDSIFPHEMHARRFDAVCGWLKYWFNVLPLDQAVARLKDGGLPARAACITFDDGYADNHDVAMPILLRHGLPATFFIATGFLDGGRMWNDTIIESVRLCKSASLDLGDMGRLPVGTAVEQTAAIKDLIGRIKYLPVAERVARAESIARAAHAEPPANLMMTSAQVLSMRHAGMQIGAHTVSHPILVRLGEAQVREEIGGSKDYLEQLLGERVGLFAYPNGKPGDDYDARAVAVVRELGFDAAVSTQWGAARTGTDLFQIPRYTPWNRTRSRFGLGLLGTLCGLRV